MHKTALDFDAMKSQLLSCRVCAEKFKFEPHPVFRGCVDSKIMHVSQAPSQSVHNTMMPWNDVSGNRLRREWYHISDADFYNPDNFYFTSFAHCYPGKSSSGGDRVPPACCAKKWLKREIELVNCRLYILIGAKAAGFFFPKEDFTTLVFADKRINGKPAFILPHPSPVNVRWFQKNPAFLESRVLMVEKAIHEVLNIKDSDSR